MSPPSLFIYLLNIPVKFPIAPLNLLVSGVPPLGAGGGGVCGNALPRLADL